MLVGAGVTPRLSLQVTNATGAFLLLNDSGVIPTAAEASRYAIPPRCTASYPLGSNVLSARWMGTAPGSGDLVTFVFTDNPDVVPQLLPGVAGPATADKSCSNEMLAAARFNGAITQQLTTVTGAVARIPFGQTFRLENVHLDMQTNAGGNAEISLDIDRRLCGGGGGGVESIAAVGGFIAGQNSTLDWSSMGLIIRNDSAPGFFNNFQLQGTGPVGRGAGWISGYFM
jgi:hypothetical protein